MNSDSKGYILFYWKNFDNIVLKEKGCVKVIVREEEWGPIPLLHIVKEELQHQQVPVVVFFHGFTSAKEHNLHYAYNLAEKGIRVILPDAHLHGKRAENLDEVELSIRFWEIVLTSIEELQMIYTELQKRHIEKGVKIGVGGTSMGGITTFGALKMYDWIDVASIMMGAPNFVELATNQIAGLEAQGFEVPVTEEEKNQLFEQISYFDITKNPETLKGRPIFMWHGKKDVVVPFEPTYAFYEAQLQRYEEANQPFEFMVDKSAGHQVSRPAMLRAVDWFASHLKD